MSHISLSRAIREDKLSIFIRQEEDRKLEYTDEKIFDGTIHSVVKAPRPQDQTLGSRVRGGSTGK